MNLKVCKQLRSLARRHSDLPAVRYRNVVHQVGVRVDGKRYVVEKIQRVLHPECQRALYHHMKDVARRLHARTH